MEYQTIQAQARSDRGKGAARRARAAGQLPAIAYGAGGEAVSITVDPKDLRLLHKSELGWNSPFVLAIDGVSGAGLAMLKDVQKHPISRELLHADFLRLTDDTEVLVEVPVRLVGKAPGAEQGGTVRQPLRVATVRCLPGVIPSVLDIDISLLDIGDKVMLSSVAVPEGVALVFHSDATVVDVARARIAIETVVDELGEGEDDEASEETEEE